MTHEAEPAELLGDETRARLESDVHAALKRRPTQEVRLAGVLRALAPLSLALRTQLVGALDTMVRRASFDRPLYASLVRALAEHEQPGTAELIGRALGGEDGGGLSTLSAACFCGGSELGEPLARAAISRHAHVAFAAEIARLSRGESDGAAVASIAPKIKESHRIALCVELLVPLLARPRLPLAIAPALAVLRDAERHLGRWLVLAEIAARAGDSVPREQARERALNGPESARAAWSMVLWALEPGAGSPSARPTVELVARLSDRPSADKDTTFLFRLASARVPSARPMLESLAKSGMLGDECAIRAMLHLLRDYGQERYREQLTDIARAPRNDPLRALAAAALFDAGELGVAVATAAVSVTSRHLPALAWGTLVRAHETETLPGGVLTELRYRRIQLGWLE